MAYANSINSGVTGILNAASGGGFTGVALTQYNALIGGSANAITSVVPGATSGVPLVSNGASSNPSFSTASVSGGGSGAVSFTAYMPVTAGTSSTAAFQSVATGTSNYILQSGGASALPTWISTSGMTGGKLVLIQSQAVSAVSSVTFSSGITATYNNYVVLGSNLTVGATPNILGVQVSTDGGITYKTTGYVSGANSSGYNSGPWTGNFTLTTGLFVCRWQASFQDDFFFRIYNLTSGSNYIESSGESTNLNPSSTFNMRAYTGIYATASTTGNALKFVLTSSTITGTLTLYGIKES